MIRVLPRQYLADPDVIPFVGAFLNGVAPDRAHRLAKPALRLGLAVDGGHESHHAFSCGRLAIGIRVPRHYARVSS